MSFQVIPSTVPVFSEEWIRARGVPASELPQLTEIQKRDAEVLSIREEEYKRFHVLMKDYVLSRQQRQGEAFGSLIEQMIKPLGERYSLETVSRRGTPSGWRVTINDRQRGIVEFQSPFEVVQALVEGSASREEFEGFRDDLYEELGQPVNLGVAS
jgi:hypothetical protein